MTYGRSAAIFVALLFSAPVLADRPSAIDQRVERVLRETPIIDGHNDLPWEIRENYASFRQPIDLAADTSHLAHPLETDIPRLRAGHVGGQFWSVWIPATLTGPAAIQTTLEQIDLVHRMIALYPQALELALTAADIRRIEHDGRIASLIGVEGGHQIGNSPAALRSFYALGVRYMTLSHSTNNDFADSATDAPLHHGLTPFGRAIVHEMNRLGMLVDLSHVSAGTMRQAIALSTAPVIFSHSSARAITGHPRNVPDDVLRMLPANGGVVMANFYPGFVSERYRARAAARAAEDARLKTLEPGDPDARRAGMSAWDSAHPEAPATIADVADHIDHLRQVAGVEHVGIGSDFDGTGGIVPRGLEGVDRYPALFAELARRGWSDTDLAKLAGGNLLRALEGAERAAAAMRAEPPLNGTIEEIDGPPAPPAH
jgi:membrane dipeptidase